MKFSVLAEILSNANMITDIKIGDDCEVSDLNLMDQDFRNFNNHTVYFIDAGQIGRGTAIPHSLIYSNEIPPFRAKDLVNSARVTLPSLAPVFRHVKGQLDMSPQAQEQYIDIVSKLMMGSDLNAILSEISSRTGNLFAAIDMSGKILTISSPFYVDYPLWMHSAQQGYCDEILMDYIEARRRTSCAPKGSVPFSLYCGKINMYILCTRIIHGHDLLGYFFAINRNPHFDNQTKRLIPLIIQRLKDSILRLKSANNYSSIMQNNILLDAVAGATPTETRLRAKVSGLKFPSFMRVFVMRSSYFKDHNFFSQVLLPKAAEILPGQACFPWKNSLVTLVSTDINGNIPQETLSALEAFANENHLLIGISNRFTDISQFAEFYEQAQAALSFAKRSPHKRPFFYFLDYSLYMILDKVEDDQLLDQHCHPALARLLEYDAKKNTELFNTLRVYTQAGFNKSRTAQLLFSHRNTISYRIQQIEQICGIDLSNEDLLFTLQLSFNIYFYRKERFIGNG